MHISPKHPETCRLIPSFTPLYIPDLPPISIKKFQKMLDFPNAGLTGNDPDRLSIGGGGASGFRQHSASCHLRSRVHDYSSPAFDKQACQIIVGDARYSPYLNRNTYFLKTVNLRKREDAQLAQEAAG